MSRVRLIDIYNGRFDESSLKLSASADIEVVPRKMVEMIIEKCVQDFRSPWNDGSMAYEASCIKDYVESLLKQFEED